MDVSGCCEPPGWWLWSDPPKHESLRGKRSPHILPFWVLLSPGEFLGTVRCPWGGTKSWWDPGVGARESNTLQAGKLWMATGLLGDAFWPRVGYLPVRTCSMGLWPLFETSSLRVYFGWAQAFIKFLGNGRLEAWLVKGGVGRWENGLRRRVFHYPVIASLAQVLRLRVPLRSCRLLKRGERKGGERGESFLPHLGGRIHP